MSRTESDDAPQVSFVDFWPNFDKSDNFFLKALSGVKSSQHLKIHSVFGARTKKLASKVLARINWRSSTAESENRVLTRRVWFTGENIRPPMDSKFEHFISFDQDDYCGKNTYFPLFYAELLLSGKESINRRGVAIDDPEELLKPRRSNLNAKNFVCAFISNPEPTRLRALDELSRYGQVEIFGPYTRRPVANKFEVARHFKYMLCFENDLFPGYITEKLLDAYLCDTVPLYWGNLGRESHVNRKAFINAAEFESLESFSRLVGNLSAGEYEEIYSQPLLSSLPSIGPFQRALLGG